MQGRVCNQAMPSRVLHCEVAWFKTPLYHIKQINKNTFRRQQSALVVDSLTEKGKHVGISDRNGATEPASHPGQAVVKTPETRKPR